MDIEIICVGKLKEKYLKQGIAEYMKRLGAYGKVKIIEVADLSTDVSSEAEAKQVLDKEAAEIRRYIKPGRRLIVTAIEGQLISSEELAQQMDRDQSYGQSKWTILIGGSLGLAQDLKNEADWSISLGRITLPHQLMRLVLVEQIYRGYRIINGHAYHK